MFRGRTNLQRVCLGQLALTVFVIALVAFPVFAQLPTGTILGVVKDTSGGVVGSASITVTNTDTALSRTAMTGEDGAYRFSALPVGNYEMKISKDGFQSVDRKGLVLAVGEEANIEIALQVGSTGQTVTVTEEAPLVDTTSSSVGGLVNEDKMADLPLNGRNYTDLTLMQTGVNSVKSAGTSAGQGVGEWYSSNGAPPRSNQYMLDGAILTNAAGATASSMAGTTLGLDGIREYKVVTNTFSAEYGLSMGSQVSMVSRSGANTYHGTAFEYLRNSALDARNYFDILDQVNANGFGSDKSFAYPGKRLPEFQRNDFGAAFGGPIKKDKTFYFVTYEQLKQNLGLSIVDNVPPASCHPNLGSAALPAVDTGCFAANGATTGKSVVVNPITYSLLALFPNPSLPQTATQGQYPNKFIFTGPYIQPSADHFGQIRVDQNFTAADSMFVRYTVDDGSELQGSSAFYPTEYFNDWYSRNQFTTVSETHIFSPTLVNSGRFSFSRTLLNAQTPTTIPAGVPLLTPNFREGSVSITGITGFGPDCCDPSRNLQNLFTFADDVFYTHGKNAFKFGTLIDFVHASYGLAAFVDGTASFSSLANMLGVNSTTFAPLAGSQPVFLSAQNELPNANEYRNMRYATYGFYGQDDYRVNSRLTLNIGLRYEFNTTPSEINGYGSALTSLNNNTGTVGPMQQNHSKYDFSPRVGFAWDVFGNGKTALRGGGGVFYDIGNIGALVIQQEIGTPPFSGRTTVSSTPNNAFTNAPTFVLPLQTWFNEFGVNGNTAAPVQTGKYLQTIGYNGGQPHLWVSNLTVERQLPFDSSLSVGYAMSRGDQIYRLIEGNPTVPISFDSNGLPVYATINSSGVATIPNLQRVNPNWNSIRNTVPIAYTWYDALQVSYTKRVTHGLQFQLNYTFSKLLDTTQGVLPNDGTGGSGSLGADPFNQFYDKGVAVYNIPSNIKFNAIYHVPQFGRTEGILSKAENGWWLGTIVSKQTGYPFTPTLGANRSLGGVDGGAASVDRPNWAPGCNASNAVLGSPSGWFNPACFTVPAIGTLGNVSRDALTGPGLAEVDLSINKDTKARFLGEAGSIQFRAEIFNIMNHPNFALPAAGVASPPTVGGTGAAITTCPATGCAISAIGGVASNGTIAATGGVGGITSTGTNTSRQIQLALRVIF